MDATRGEQTQAAKRGLSMPVNHRVRWLFPLLTWLVAAAMALVLTLSLLGSEAHATGPVATVSPAAYTENVSVPVSFSSGSQDIWSPVYRSRILGHLVSGNHAAAPVLGESAWRTAAGVRWPWRSTSQASL